MEKIMNAENERYALETSRLRVKSRANLVRDLKLILWFQYGIMAFVVIASVFKVVEAELFSFVSSIFMLSIPSTFGVIGTYVSFAAAKGKD